MRPLLTPKATIMKKNDVRTVNGVDFIYIGNDVNGNCKYAVNYRYFLNESEMSMDFEKRMEFAKNRAKAACFDRPIYSHLEPFFIIRPVGRYAEVVRAINKAKAEL